ncbi:hypothetical protein [Nonomuraea jabiensis]|uniref:hypothetical protein n=1 Tax=Nonomuraea jabiensis TaxID=882448 RepID=UPI003D72031E
MRTIAASLFISLDGDVEEPAEWHFPYVNDETGAAVGGQTVGTLLLGRKTYDSFAAAWRGRRVRQDAG